MKERVEQIKADLDRYWRAMSRSGGWATCLAIEKRYELDGYPPEIVTAALTACAEGEDMLEVIDRLLGEES